MKQLDADLVDIVVAYKRQLEECSRKHHGSVFDGVTLSFYSGIMTALEGLVLCREMEEYIFDMVSLIKAGADDILYNGKRKDN